MVYTLFVLTTIALLVKYHVGNCKDQRLIYITFFLMWIIFSIEYYTTIDYPVYYNGFYDINEKWEPLYQLLLRTFRPFGFIAFNSCTAAFEMFTLCFVFTKITPPKYRWVVLMILLLNPQELFAYMTVKRQFLAMMFALWIVYFLYFSTNKYRLYFAIATYLCAVNIHTSAYITIIYFIVYFINIRFNKITILLILAFYLLSANYPISQYADQLFFLLELTERGADGFYEIYINEIEDYEQVGRSKSIFYMIYEFLLLSLLLFYNKYYDNRQYKLLMFSVIALILTNILKGNIYRMNFYFSIFHLFTIPVLLQILYQLRKTKLIICLIVLGVGMAFRGYYNVFSGNQTTNVTEKYRFFYTIFDKNPDKKTYYK